MSFTDDFNACLSFSGPPTPRQVFDSVSDALEFVHQVHTAWEAAGGDEKMTLAALARAATGIDEGVFDEGMFIVLAGRYTVSFYLDACIACLVRAWSSTRISDTPISWRNFLASTNDSWVQNQLTVVANDQGIDTSA